MADGRVLSLEFSAGTLMHLTPLVLMYPHLQRLVIEHNSNIMSTIFSIAFQVSFGSYHQLPNLRTAIITHGVLQKNELITLISMAPNLEEFQCRKAVVKLDLLEFETALENCRIKRLRIKAYSERTKTPDRHELNSRQTNLHSRQSPLILRFMPLLEELVLGIEYMQTLDLSANQRIRYVDFTRHTHVVSFIQPPQSLEVCLNAPHLNATNFRAEITDDFEAANDGPDGDLKPWTDPPRFKRLSLVSPPLRPSIFSRAVCNSYVSLESLSVSSSSNGRTDSLGLPLPDNIVSWENEKLFLNVLGDHLILFLSLRQLNVQSGLVGEPFLSRVAQLTSLEYFSIAGAGVHALHVLHFLESSRSCPLKEVNVQGSMAGQQLQGYDGEEVEMTIKFKVAVVAKERGIILKTGLPPRRPYDVVYDMY